MALSKAEEEARYREAMGEEALNRQKRLADLDARYGPCMCSTKVKQPGSHHDQTCGRYIAPRLGP